MEFAREKLVGVMDVVERGEIEVVAYKGRLARFGLDYLEHELGGGGW